MKEEHWIKQKLEKLQVEMALLEENNSRHQFRRDQVRFQSAFYKLLQCTIDQFPYLYVSQGMKGDFLPCDAVLLTSGGVYVFHLLPVAISSISINFPVLEVEFHYPSGEINSTSEIGEELVKAYKVSWTIGTSKQKVGFWQQKRNLTGVPIYEFYIAPQASPIYYHLDHALVANVEFVSKLFQESFVFQKQEENLKQQEILYQFLTTSLQKEEESPNTELPVLIEEGPFHRLPPRRKKRKSETWITRLFGKSVKK